MLKTFLQWQSAYTAHDDAAAAAASIIAYIVALNGPFYPLYVYALTDVRSFGVLGTMIATPFFFAVPWLARQSSLAGRAALPLIGVVNTVWCVKLLGPGSGVELFCIPCIMLAALLFRGNERWLGVAMIGLSILPALVPADVYGVPLLAISPADAARLAPVNAVCVMMLMGLIALQFAKLLSAAERTAPLKAGVSSPAAE